MEMLLPEKTVNRLSKYRRLLSNYQYLHDPYIFSHDLARLLNINPVQVRRDLMLIGSSGNNRRGYHVHDLIDRITEVISLQECKNIAIVGFGRLGQAICNLLIENQVFLQVVAAFDIDGDKINREFCGVNCYDISKIPEIVMSKNVKIAILTIPDDYASELNDILIENGIRGVLNFTSVRLDAPAGIFIKDFDIKSSLEEVSYFAANK